MLCVICLTLPYLFTVIMHALTCLKSKSELLLDPCLSYLVSSPKQLLRAFLRCSDDSEKRNQYEESAFTVDWALLLKHASLCLIVMEKLVRLTDDGESKKARGRGESDAAPAATGSDDVSSSSLKRDVGILADCIGELGRFNRQIQSVVFFTFVFAVNSVSDALSIAGQDTDAMNKESKKKKKKAPIAQCARKWCSLIISLKNALLEHIKEKKVEKERKSELDDIVDVFNEHQKSITDLSMLDASGMHCESRYNHDKSKCILVLTTRQYPRILQAIVETFAEVYSCKPEEGPAPATRREKKANKIMEKYRKE